ncbi:MAG: site-2 protease family protein [Pilosibacter sp.]
MLWSCFSANLGGMNLLPFPALDGGRLAILTLGTRHRVTAGEPESGRAR